LNDGQIVNICAALCKSSRHLGYIFNRGYDIGANMVSPWDSYKARQRNLVSMVTSLRPHVAMYVPANGALVAAPAAATQTIPAPEFTSTEPETVEAPTVDRELIILAFESPKPYKMVCAATRRLVNLVEWASAMEVKLTSQHKFKWDTFDLISARKKYLQKEDVE
jgi:hypothetical protein